MKGEFLLAHFNPRELEGLDHLQGGRHYEGNTEIPTYRHLEEKFKDPHFKKRVIDEYEHHRRGGTVGEIMIEAERMKHKGRHGDSEMAFIGPHMESVFNHLLGTDKHKNRNPHTKKPEFFGLSNFLGGLKHTFAPVGRAIGSVGSDVMHTAQKALPGAMSGAIQGGMMGGPEGALAGAAMGGMGSAMMPQQQMGGQMGGYPGQQQQQGNPYSAQMNSMNQSGQNALENYGGQGMNMMDRFNQMGQSAIQNLANRASQGMNQGTAYGKGKIGEGMMAGSNAMNQANQYGQNVASQMPQQQQMNPYGGGYGSPYGGYGGYGSYGGGGMGGYGGGYGGGYPQQGMYNNYNQ